MRLPTLLSALLLSVFALAPAVPAEAAKGGGLEGWLKSPAEAVKAAKQSGKPILVVTCWGNGI